MSLLKNIFVVFIFLWISCDACPVNETCDVNLDDQNIKDMINSILSFSNSIINLMFNQQNSLGNVILSPASIYNALASILFGSKGTTQTELITALGFPQTDLKDLVTALGDIFNSLRMSRTVSVDSKDVYVEDVILGQRIFLQQDFTILETYNEILGKLGADTEKVDFTNDATAATQSINDWIASTTGNRETFTMTTSADSSALVFLATTIYFKAKWDGDLFDAAKTITGKFRTPSFGTQDVSMMVTTKELLYYDNQLSYSALQLPYHGGDYTMLIVLPYGDIAPQDFVKDFKIDEYKVMVEKSQKTAIECHIPKFLYVWSGTLAEQLKTLQINQMFSDADLGNMIQNPRDNMAVSQVSHSAGVQIDEIGAIGASMSSVPVEKGTSPDNPKNFVVDHSFLFFIRNVKTNLIIFAGYMRQI